MSLRRLAAAVLPVALAAAPVAAQDWQKVAELPGGIAVEMDRQTLFEGLDGNRMVLMATFRKQLANTTMETAAAVDCARKQAKIRGVRLLSDGEILSEKVMATAEFAPINPGSAEATYYTALCGEEIALPPPGEEGGE